MLYPIDDKYFVLLQAIAPRVEQLALHLPECFPSGLSALKPVTYLIHNNLGYQGYKSALPSKL